MSQLVINLNDCFPEPSSVNIPRGPLPAQKLFLNMALDPKGPKYIRYCGGIGSGKTLIGCITVIHWAILHQGDYLIARQFSPELRDTTLKVFLEVCPPELIVERRVADNIIRIRTASGGISDILFRALEEPDKHRSLTLSGFYIDEASQVSEEAFIQLQGRLRGKGLKKGIITQNPNGHDWTYRWFVKKDHISGEDRLSGRPMKDLFFNLRAPSTDNIHLPVGYVESLYATWSKDRIAREIEASDDTFEGQVYAEFNRQTHVIPPFAIPGDWTKIVGVDHGYRNPSAWVWAAVDYDGNIYIYREFYESGWLIEEICDKGKDGKPSVMALMGNEKIEAAYIDPSTNRRSSQTGLTDYGTYLENLPGGFPLVLANNEKTPGIDRVKSYLKVDPRTNKPSIYFFDNCVNIIDEMVKYRYAELRSNQHGSAPEKEEPVKVNDHALDALRYLIMSRPDSPKNRDGWEKNFKGDPVHYAFRKYIQSIKTPKVKINPFSGNV